ncbi:unnamed protein product [Oppiella nova]|uniref:Uncharacterized protein n=1 Tax=Oppiella nova TaxID=334625 RepID=A0A7R9LUA0_9ACAR|nr:unnamed protein product [Oppiella nova]CAG2166718.1 unnamed protein product [Oppiella nova]
MAMFPHIFTHAAIYPSFLRSPHSTPTTTSLSPEFSHSATNTSFLVENILRDRAAAAAVVAGKDVAGNQPLISRPLPLHAPDQSPCGYSHCNVKQCISDLIKHERSADVINSSDHETESSYGADHQSESNTPPTKTPTPLKFGVSAILSDHKSDHFYANSNKHHFLSHQKDEKEGREGTEELNLQFQCIPELSYATIRSKCTAYGCGPPDQYICFKTLRHELVNDWAINFEAIKFWRKH